jgi:hypothetical protein
MATVSLPWGPRGNISSMEAFRFFLFSSVYNCFLEVRWNLAMIIIPPCDDFRHARFHMMSFPIPISQELDLRVISVQTFQILC